MAGDNNTTKGSRSTPEVPQIYTIKSNKRRNN